MTQEEKEKYYAIFEYNVADFRITSRVSKNFSNDDPSIDEIFSWIKDCFDYDMIRLKREIESKLNEVPKVSDNLDSE